MVGNFEIAKRLGASTADTVKIKRRTEIHFLHLDVIEPDPDQPRQEFDKEGLARLAESLRKVGQLQPVLVRKEGSRYILVAGERRWKAAKLAGMATIQAVLWKKGDARSIQLIENLLREDLKPIEQANAFKAIIEKEKWSARELARQLAIEHSGITRALKLLKLPPETQALVDKGKIPPTTAYEITKRPKSEHKKLGRAAAAGKLKGDDLRRQTATPAPKLAPEPEPAPTPTPAATPAPPPISISKPPPVLTLGGVAAAWSHRHGKVQVAVTGHRAQDDVIAALEAALAVAKAQKKSLRGGLGGR